MKKILNIALIALMVVAVVAVIPLFLGKEDLAAHTMLIVTYIYLVLGVGAMVGMTIANMGKSRNNSRIGLFVWGGVVVLGVILYFVGSSATVIGADGTVFDNVFTLKVTDAMLILTYVTLGFTVLGMVGGEVWKALK